MKLTSDGESFKRQDCARVPSRLPFHRYTDEGLDGTVALEIEQYEQHVRFQVAPLVEALQEMDRTLREGKGLPRKISHRRIELPGEGPQSFVHLGRPFSSSDLTNRTLRVQTDWAQNGSWPHSGVRFPIDKRRLLREASSGGIRRKDLILLAQKLALDVENVPEWHLHHGD